jgi:hypothetical protein
MKTPLVNIKSGIAHTTFPAHSDLFRKCFYEGFARTVYSGRMFPRESFAIQEFSRTFKATGVRRNRGGTPDLLIGFAA